MVGFIQPLLDKLNTISELQHAQIWNSQFDYLEDGNSYAFPMPCAFVETLPMDEIGTIGSGYQAGDLTIKIHLGSNFFNNLDGSNFDDNFNIFSVRSAVVTALYGFASETSGVMVKINEEQDFNHSNVYHYVLTYKVHFVDTTTAQPTYFTAPPTTLNITHG